MNERFDDDASTGGRLVSTNGRVLPLEGVELTAHARGGAARVVLEQRFRNPHPDPLHVSYLFPLPHDAAVSGFAFRLGERRIVGEVDRTAAARERFERALIEGRSAALLDEERGSVFTQELGNVPPGAEVVAELTIDQKLAWLPEGAWEWRFPTAVAPRYGGAEGCVADAERTRVDVAAGPIAARLRLRLEARDALAEGRTPESPSHALRFEIAGGGVRATLVEESGAPLDRDVVVRWPVAAREAGLAADGYRAPAGASLDGRAFSLLTLVPPQHAPAAIARDLVVLLDTSGSMHGEPLAQARRVVEALVGSLSPADRLELIAFSSTAQRWRAAPAEATEAARADALAWLASRRAGGGTEMRHAIDEALRPLRPDAQRQVVLVTDGHVGFEPEIVARVLAGLPPGSRLHTLGVGSAVNRSLTAPAARAGRGREVVIGLGEDPERAARTLRAHTAAPIVTELTVSGDAVVATAPARLPDLYAGAPALVTLEVRPAGGTVTVRGRTAQGAFERSVRVPALPPGEGNAAVAALFGREAVEDLEARAAAGERGVEADIERLGLAFQLSTRLTSWVAVSEEPTTDPKVPFRRERMPQALPYGMSVEGLGLRGPPQAMVEAGCGVFPSSAPAEPVFRSIETWNWRRFEAYPSVPPPMRTVGRVVSHDGGVLVIEIAFDEEVDWEPPATLHLAFDDGRSKALGVDQLLTTASCTVRSGQVIRVALRVPQALAGRWPTALRGSAGGRELRVPIEPRPR